MKTTRLPSVLFAILVLLSAAVFAEEDYSKVQIKTQKLTNTTYMLTGSGGNLGVSVGDDAVFVIDDQFAPLTPKIKEAIAKLSKKPVKFVLNTHWHFDHTGGNENFGKAGAVIVAHENVRKRMSRAQAIEFFNMEFKPSPKQALPVVTFTTDVTFHLNNDEIHVFHVANGHTDGDAIVHFKKSNVMHLGDIFFNKLYPFIDNTNGGSVDGVIAAVDKVLGMVQANTKIIPGHGPLGTKADLLAYRIMLGTVSDRLKLMAKEGKKLEDAIASKPTREFDKVWGGGFLSPDKFVEVLWKGL